MYINIFLLRMPSSQASGEPSNGVILHPGLPLQWERRRTPTILGHWSSDDIYSQRESTPAQSVRRNSLGSYAQNDANNFVINIDGINGNANSVRVQNNSNNDEENSDDSAESDSGNQNGEEEQGEGGGNSVR